MSKVILITGCSTGIGRDLAVRLNQLGYCVIATARKLEAIEDLDVALKLQLDVTESKSIRDAVDRSIGQFGRIDVLVNNAGYAVQGAVEEVPVEQVQEMFDVNLYGAQRMIQAVLPYMRTQRSGHIINISSIAGKLSSPANGMYSATKFALDAMSDALRLEVEGFGIQVVTIAPGAIKTHFDETVSTRSSHLISNPASTYRAVYEASQRFSEGMRNHEPGPEAVSRVVQQAIEARRPKARYLAAIPYSGRLVLLLRDLIWNPILRQMFKIAVPQKNTRMIADHPS